ncbi:MAG TPA: phage tail protein [Polyangiaceae bacterium]
MANGDYAVPFKNFRFRITISPNDKPSLFVSKISGLKRTTEVITHREGNDVSTPRHAPGRTSFQPITLERGVTLDPEFEKWADQVFNHNADDGISLENYKRNLTIELLNMQGIPIRKYNVYKAWVSEYTAQADLDANANAILVESIVVQNEGWIREDIGDAKNEQ